MATSSFGSTGDRAGGSADASADTGNTGILVVDDDPLIREILRRALQQEGFTVAVAADGGEACEVFRQRQQDIDLVLLDVRLPGSDGPATLAALRRLDPGVPCCFMSGNLGRYTEEELLQQGASHVYHKPFPLEEFLRTLGQWLRHPA